MIPIEYCIFSLNIPFDLANSVVDAFNLSLSAEILI